MSTRGRWGTSPRASVVRASELRGRSAVVDGCLGLLDGEVPDPELVQALAGPASTSVLADRTGASDHWLRVWALRGLGWVWDPAAAPAVVGAFDDEHWRVREMAVRVCARHLADDTLHHVVPLLDDSSLRVRVAAGKAVERLAGIADRGPAR